MNHPVDSQLVARLQAATGIPVLLAKQQLEQFTPEQQLVCVIASEKHPSGFVCDPQENDEVAGPIIREVLAKVSQRIHQELEVQSDDLRSTASALRPLNRYRGMCYRIWRDAKLELRSNHGIDWQSPAAMNPHIIFD